MKNEKIKRAGRITFEEPKQQARYDKFFGKIVDDIQVTEAIIVFTQEETDDEIIIRINKSQMIINDKYLQNEKLNNKQG